MKSRRRYTREQWSEWLVEQRGSGKSVALFCRQKRVSVNSFYCWRRKLSDGSERGERSNPFVALSVIGNEQVQIDMPCGATIRVPSDESLIRQVLSILVELGGKP